METDGIAAFVKIAQLGGFGRAAAALHRTQPAISRRIDALEAELKAPLFERAPGGVLLTEAGQALLPFAEGVLASLRDAAEAVHAVAHGGRGELRLAIVGTLAGTSVMRILQQLRRDHPGVQVDMQTASSSEVGQLVRRGEAALGLRYHPDPSPQLVSRLIGYEELQVVATPDHPLTRATALSPKHFMGERWVAFTGPQGSREPYVAAVKRGLAAAGIEDPEITPVDSLIAQKRLVEAGFGIAIMPRSGIQEELRDGTLAVLNTPAMRSQLPIYAVVRRSGYLNAAAEDLLRRLEAEPVVPLSPTKKRRSAKGRKGKRR